MIRSFRLFWLIIKHLNLTRFFAVFVGWYVISSVLLWVLDPSIQTLGDGFWFAFILVTTIGFGDYTVAAWPARIVAVLLGLYGDLVIIFLTGTVTSWFYEKYEEIRGLSLARFMDQLEHLDQLSDDELDEVAQTAKKLRPDKEDL